MKRLLTLIFILLPFMDVHAKLIDIGVFPEVGVKSFIFTPLEGNYTIFTETGRLRGLEIGVAVTVNQQTDKISLHLDGKFLGSYEKVNFIGTGTHNFFELSLKSPIGKKANFDDNLKLYHRNAKMQIVNNIDLENYIAGVVEAEVGRLPPKEYLKLQAIICRTYALGNMHKHYLDGYNLCSEVHCQAYNGKTLYRDILEAVYSTKNIVVVDSDISLITAVFHSSCGGQTVNSEDVWTTPVYYLRSVVDSFCIKGKNAHWEKTVDANDWESYFKNELSANSLSSVIYSNGEPERRENFMKDMPLSMRKIRTDWHLKSTFFTAEKLGDKVLIKGRGFGHGVGLCQIGAMEMARRSYTYAEILHHYYRGVHLINLEALDFFRDKP